MHTQHKHHKPTASKHINILVPHELRNWSKHLEVSMDTIKQAVKRVGPTVARVKLFLGK